MVGWLLSLGVDSSLHDTLLVFMSYWIPWTFLCFLWDLSSRSSRASQHVGGDCDLFGMSNNAEIIRSRKEIESKLNDSVF